MTIEIHPSAYEIVNSHPNTLLFASISGAHLYGFPSENSDWDIRGAHLLPIEAVIGLQDYKDVYEFMAFVNEVEIDLVSYDLKKFCNLIRRKNGNVLEQLASPLQITNSESGTRLREFGARALTKNHIGHYRGMAKNRSKAFEKDRLLKAALYAIRALMTGIHLLEEKKVIADLGVLKDGDCIDSAQRRLIVDLIERKASEEKGQIDADLFAPAQDLIDDLFERIELAFQRSDLPLEVPELIVEMDAFLISQRLG